ncbi:hypothetical protein ACWKWZ_16260 [Metapseudomonas otitidis]
MRKNLRCALGLVAAFYVGFSMVSILNTVVFIHPEGNHLNNPTLYEISGAIARRGASALFLPGDSYYGGRPKGLLSRLLNKILADFGERLPRFTKCLLVLFLYARHFKAISRSTCIVGVDHCGIIQAEFLSSLFRKRLGFFSFEIMFADELGARKKEMEVAACRSVSFCVVQDHVREKLLALQNNINFPSVLVPIGNAGLPTPQGWRVRDKLGIPMDKKVAIIIGSLADWTCADDIIRAFCVSSDSTWCLIVHGRFDGESAAFLNGFSNSKIFMSTEPMDFNAMASLFDGVDVGLAFYKSVPGNPFLGKNIEYIGLASGKISNYLRHGVPVITNLRGEIGDLILRYNAGFVVPGATDIFLGLSCLEQSMSDGAISLFGNVFDFSNYEDQLIKQLLPDYSSNAK